MEDEIRGAVANMKPGDAFTPDELAWELGFPSKEVRVWLDLMAGEGRLIPEHGGVLWERGLEADTVVRYRVPPRD